MKKPRKRCVWYYEYDDIRQYLNHKHGINISDYAGKYKHAHADFSHQPYQNFWLSLIDKVGFGPGIHYLSIESFEDGQQWEIDIRNLICKEFGEGKYKLVRFLIS